MSLTTEDIQIIKQLLEGVGLKIEITESNLNQRIDSINNKLETIDNRIDSLQTAMESGFDNISPELVRFAGVIHQDQEKRIVALERKINHSN